MDNSTAPQADAPDSPGASKHAASAEVKESGDTSVGARPGRKRGARKLQILQALAGMLEDPRGEKVTTAALAARLEVSEAALYRHFASKAQMFEGLIEFIETTVFGLINEVAARETSGLRQARRIAEMLLDFAQTNRGMTRVLIGDALVNENDRLQDRMNALVDRVEASLKQSLRVAVAQAEVGEGFDPNARAAILVSYVLGRWQRFAKTGFKRSPVEGTAEQLGALIPAQK